ncbi:MAG: UDP-N-acetylmuramate dehydrogenase, partial [Clostridiales bacterium]|nr:UDP-N-acetylmuramate dehydrogenase [Clostridiales bacterium]
SGLEFVFGIPSTVGGLVRMNAGAFGREINDVLVSCEILTPAGEVELLKPKMSYRFSEIDGIVLSATFVLDYLESHEISSEIKRLTALRMEKQPQEPSCGSVFKAHQNESAAKFIEATGLKGMRIGGAQISPKHCNFIVNLGGATTKDFMELCEKVEETVYYEFGIKLEREFKYLGET